MSLEQDVCFFYITFSHFLLHRTRERFTLKQQHSKKSPRSNCSFTTHNNQNNGNRDTRKFTIVLSNANSKAPLSAPQNKQPLQGVGKITTTKTTIWISK